MERSAPTPSQLLWENCAGAGRVLGTQAASPRPARHQPTELTAPATGGNPLPTQLSSRTVKAAVCPRVGLRVGLRVVLEREPQDGEVSSIHYK